jgi:copper chaperone
MRRKVTMATKTYQVPAISCGHCTATIERELKEVAGVFDVKADLNTKRVVVDAKDDAIFPQVELTMAEIGYPAE